MIKENCGFFFDAILVYMDLLTGDLSEPFSIQTKNAGEDFPLKSILSFVFCNY